MKLILAGVAVLAFAVPSYGQTATSPVLDKLMAEFVVAFNAKDAARLASFYAEDGVLMPPDAPLVKGRGAIEAVVKQLLASPSVLKLSPMESEIVGNRGYSAGTYTVTIPQGSSLALTGVGGSGSVLIPAKYLTVFKRVGNDWKIAYDMQNASQPPPK